MSLVVVKSTEHRLARAWYVKYPLDAYALGPLGFFEPVKATCAIALAREQFGERPCEVWPADRSADITEVEEYEIELEVLA